MNTKQIFAGLLLTAAIFTVNAQNVQSDANVTSGGLNAGSGGTGNTFYGYRAGNDTNGEGNTFIGHQSGLYNYLGGSNVFLGTHSGMYNENGNRNVFIGTGAGQENNGSDNVYVGFESGRDNCGSRNTYLGPHSGINIGDCTNDNIFIGYQAGGESTGSNNIFIGNNSGFSTGESNQLRITMQETETPLIWGDFALNQLKFHGKAGVGYGFGNFPITAGGVNLANYNLFVKGGLLAEEVRVNLQSDWADYVFDESYQLPSLNEVAQFIKENKHLPNVPSARQVKDEGIELGEMARIQQEKIEELTLYLIEQENRLERQEREIKELKEIVQLLLKKD